MDTKSIDPLPQDGNPGGGKRKFAGHAAAAVAGVGMGVAATAVAQELENEDGSAAESQTVSEPVEMVADIETSESVEEALSDVQPEPVETVPEPSPEVEEPVAGPQEPVSAGTLDSEVNGERPDPVVDETVDPDAIADAIISEIQVDPNDLDMADVYNFDSIGTVYTVDGESYTAAAFHDASGSSYVMVDVDGDDTFDLIADSQGYPLSDAPGNITVDDVEMGISPETTYLAQNGNEREDGFGGADFMDDIINNA